MSRSSKVKIGSHWSKPPTRIYDYNYNFQEGYYKPMVDHLDRRDHGIREEAPGAQTFAERVARHCPGCLASRDPAQTPFGPAPHPAHNHPWPLPPYYFPPAPRWAPWRPAPMSFYGLLKLLDDF